MFAKNTVQIIYTVLILSFYFFSYFLEQRGANGMIQNLPPETSPPPPPSPPPLLHPPPACISVRGRFRRPVMFNLISIFEN